MSANLVQTITQMIDSHQGKISFYDYMRLVLYDVREGYYTAHIPGIGEKGDFITAPTLSPLFGRCLTDSFLPLIKQMDNVVIVELGGGTGSLAKSILASLCAQSISIQQYIIVDISEPLKKIQQENLKPYLSQIRWVDSLDEVRSISGIVIANEFLDAFPVRKFCYQPQENILLEYFVKKNSDLGEEKTFEWCLQKADKTLKKELSFLKDLDLPEIYQSEYHPDIPSVIEKISKMLVSGAVFFIDYGYPRKERYHPCRDKGTLRCYFQHILSDYPFYKPGFQDITAHVDFTAVAEAAVLSGFEIPGFTSQAAFLLSLGILQKAQSHEDKQAIKILTLPQEMGEIIKVMTLTKNVDISPLGFELQDRKGTL